METEEMKKEMLNKINLEETRKLKLAETLKETIRMAGDYRMLAKVFEDEGLDMMFEKSVANLKELIKNLSTHLSTL